MQCQWSTNANALIRLTHPSSYTFNERLAVLSSNWGSWFSLRRMILVLVLQRVVKCICFWHVNTTHGHDLCRWWASVQVKDLCHKHYEKAFIPTPHLSSVQWISNSPEFWVVMNGIVHASQQGTVDRIQQPGCFATAGPGALRKPLLWCGAHKMQYQRSIHANALRRLIHHSSCIFKWSWLAVLGRNGWPWFSLSRMFLVLVG